MSEHPTKRSSDLLEIASRSQTIGKANPIGVASSRLIQDHYMTPRFLIANLLVDKNEELQRQENEIPRPTQKPHMFKVDSTNDILSRVQAFLPQLQSANEELKKKNPEALDIEKLDDEKGQYIEMNLGLGVFEEKRNADSSNSEDESSDNEEIIVPSSSTCKHTKKPTIQMLPSHSSTNSDEE
ncbi:hypothetical protein BX666DRAFT_1876130 [Dichotomocladium elegans]|nr:hypothetical protein BX666DRAFT_1876130 [Dichotomocladium elegans]